MCTAVSFQTKDHYFGRNLDLERSYGECVTVTPRAYPFRFRNGKALTTHYALVGMAAISDGYPLYFEATNEKGLSLAGLNFPGNAVYYEKADGMDNIAPFELIPWVLGQCATVAEAEKLLEKLNLWKENFSEKLPLSPLHWLLSDKERSLVLESLAHGLQIHEAPVGVLTNNPTFDYHMHRLADFMGVTAGLPENRFAPELELKPYSLGMSTFGIPGDMSSSSRFVRAAFTKWNSRCGDSETESVSQFFHILRSVSQPNGLTCVRPGEYEFTLYSSCCNTDKGIYYYTTYNNQGLSAVELHRENLDGSKLICYPLAKEPHILWHSRW